MFCRLGVIQSEAGELIKPEQLIRRCRPNLCRMSRDEVELETGLATVTGEEAAVRIEPGAPPHHPQPMVEGEEAEQPLDLVDDIDQAVVAGADQTAKVTGQMLEGSVTQIGDLLGDLEDETGSLLKGRWFEVVWTIFVLAIVVYLWRMK